MKETMKEFEQWLLANEYRENTVRMYVWALESDQPSASRIKKSAENAYRRFSAGEGKQVERYSPAVALAIEVLAQCGQKVVLIINNNVILK
jgi:hypothetical protein